MITHTGRERRFEALVSGSPLLSYTIDPSGGAGQTTAQAFVGLKTTLTLTATNNTGNPVTLQSGRQGDQILITIPTPSGGFSEANSLTDDVNAVACQSLTAGFTAGQQSTGSPVFQVSPTSDQTLAPGSTIQVTFTVTVNNTLGSATLAITEYIGANTGAASIYVNKIPQALAVIAWFVPWNVGLNQPATLYWQSFGGTKVTVNGFNGPPQDFPVSGSPPYQDCVSVVMLRSWPQRTFQLTVSSNDGTQANGSATLTQQPQLITSFATIPASPSSPFSPTSSAQLTWSTLYAAAVYLTYPQGGTTSPVPANSFTPLTIYPGLDTVKNSPGIPPQIPPTAIYQLQAQGYSATAPTQSVSFQLGPMPVLWFKFLTNQSGSLSDVSFQLAGSWPNGAQLTQPGANWWQLVVSQPGGTMTTMNLGSGDPSNSPQIQYFNAAGASPGFTLSWVTANVTSMVLNPGGYQVPAADIANGSYAVNPSVTTTYVLTATGPNGTVNSSLPVTVSAAVLRRRGRR